MAKKKPHSYNYTARTNPRRYLLSGIPPMLWKRVQAKARRDHVAVRQIILALLDEWSKVDEVLPPESNAPWPADEPHVVGTEAPTPENDPVGRFTPPAEGDPDKPA